MENNITIKEYAEKVYKMRTAQNTYFANRKSRDKRFLMNLLESSKRIEKEVDDITDDLLGHKLF